MSRNFLASVKEINEEQEASIPVVERNADTALLMVHYGYVIENGKVVIEEVATSLRENLNATPGTKPISRQANLIKTRGILIFRFFCEILH